VFAAWLVDSHTAIPAKVIGVLSLDPRLGTQLLDLDHFVCNAGFLDYVTFIIQLAASLFGIVTTLIIWKHDVQLGQTTHDGRGRILADSTEEKPR
jgi:hypothetical protein